LEKKAQFRFIRDLTFSSVQLSAITRFVCAAKKWSNKFLFSGFT